MSYEEFRNSIKDKFVNKWSELEIRAMYEDIKLPKRAHPGDAGYDFFSPFEFKLRQNESIVIPTGIRVRIQDGWFLGCVPRSGLGFKFFAALANTFGVIDSTYYNSLNEGHIHAKVVNRNPEEKEMIVNIGQGYMQGIFIPFGLTDDDDVTGVRNGGFGSSDNIN